MEKSSTGSFLALTRYSVLTVCRSTLVPGARMFILILWKVLVLITLRFAITVKKRDIFKGEMG